MGEFLILIILLLLAIIIIISYKYYKLLLHFNEILRSELEKWRNLELNKIREQIERNIRKEYLLVFEEWKKRYEEEIRKDAINKSIQVILGKVGEQITPLIFFLNYGIEPKDIRFIGTPIDYIVFKGLSRNNVEEIWFVEVKKSIATKLSEKQKQIKDIVNKKRVKWITIYLDEEIHKMKNNKLKI